MMTMIGIISLAGIVVNNAIVLIDYTNLLRNRRKRTLALEKTDRLNDQDIKQAIIEAGRTRLRPVLSHSDNHYTWIDSASNWV